jgi:hypothetical protein
VSGVQTNTSLWIHALSQINLFLILTLYLQVAIKKIDLSSIEQGNDLTAKFGEFRREVLLMSGLEHPNLVALKVLTLFIALFF